MKYDGYRLHARLDHGNVRLLTRTGLDWTHKYPAIAAAIGPLQAKQAYLDGELCGVRPDGTISFSAIQAASDAGKSDALVLFLFDLLHQDGETITSAPLIDRKARLQELLKNASPALHLSDDQIERGREFYAKGMRVAGRRDRLEAHGCAIHASQSRVMVKTPEPGRVCRCWLDRSRGFATVPWRTPASVLHSGGRLVYAGRAGSGINNAQLERLWQRLQPLATSEMPLDVPPPRDSRFGSPLVLSRVHWVRPQLVVAIKFLSWTDDSLLRQASYQGLREDRPASEVRGFVPDPKAKP
jgi:ATP-dependent DNA ligase